MAWRSLGYEVIYYTSLKEISDSDPYYLMAIDGDIQKMSGFKKVKNSYKTFLYVQPNEFPAPWGVHPNFSCLCPPPYIEKLNNLPNILLWSFGHPPLEYHTLWGEVQSVPLAFDNFSYKKCPPPTSDEWGWTTSPLDVYYVGGWANNGFDEKKDLLREMLVPFGDWPNSAACAFFVGKDLSHKQENQLMYNSKVALNIHDAYQRALGTDVNERTFKTLGSTGVLVSDDIKCLDNFNFHIVRENDPDKYFEAAKKYVFDTSPEDLLKIKEHNVNEVLANHTYVSRVRTLLEL